LLCDGYLRAAIVSVYLFYDFALAGMQADKRMT
jgi:hypothetical protein